MKRILFCTLFALSCAHTHRTQSASTSQEEPPQKGKRVAAPRPVGTTPSAILKSDGMREIQKALASHHVRVAETGQLDDPTRHALEKFQRKNQLASTGLPDIATVRALGLDPDHVFQTGSRKKSEDAAARKHAKEAARARHQE